MWWVLQELFTEIKKSFFLFLPSPPHKCGSSALFIGGSSVRAGVRVELLPSHLPSHYPHTSGTGKYIVRGLLQNLTKVPEKYSCLVPTVQHRYTNSIAMPDYQYSYAALLVQGCCTFTGTIICNQSACHSCSIYWVNYSGEDENHIRDDFYSRFLSLMTLFGNKILSFPIKNVSLHSRKLTPMSLFGNGYDYKKRLLFTTTYIEQVKQSHKDCNRN